MLLILRDMRNLIHGPRWIRLAICTSPAEFQLDCKFAFVVAYQVMFALFETITKEAQRGLEVVEAMIKGFPDDLKPIFQQVVAERFKL